MAATLTAPSPTTTSPAWAIETNNLSKTYQSSDGVVDAVRGLNLRVASGTIYALLGPNGAGKSTTLAMLTTLLLPTSGTARVAGFDVVTQAAEVRRHIGVTFQEMVLDQDLTGRQILEFHARLYGMPRAQRARQIADLAQLVELRDVLDRKVARYSGGMKRRLELARGLMTEPAVLFLDEPTQGLDPQNRAGIWEYARTLRDEQGITLLLTTHSMDEAAALADTVGIIDHGALVIEGAPADLARSMGAELIVLSGAGAGETLAATLRARPWVQKVSVHSQSAPDQSSGEDATTTLQVGVDHGDRRLAEVVGLALEAHFAIHEISVARPSLADVFLAYTGRALRDELE